MLRLRLTSIRAAAGAICLLLAGLLFPALLRAQGLGQAALSDLPNDVSQLTYTNLRQLRNLPDYPRMRQEIVGRGLQGLSDSLRPAGVDAERDTDEVVLAWRGTTMDSGRYLGLADGRFHGRQIADSLQRSGTRAVEYAGSKIYPLRSSAVGPQIYLTFLDDSLAAFGRADDLKAVLDVRAGSRPALDTNPSMAGWEAELDGSAPEWGISMGRAAASQAAGWLTSGIKTPTPLNAIMNPVDAVLYSFDLSGGLSAHLSVVCDRAQNAAALAQILIALSSPQAAQSASPDLAAFLTSLNVVANGPRVEIDGAGPLSLLGQFIH